MRQPALVAVHDEPGRLVGAVDVNDAAVLHRPVGRSCSACFWLATTPTGHAAQPAVAANQRLAVLRLVLVEGPVVENARQQIAHIVFAAWPCWNSVQRSAGGRPGRRSQADIALRSAGSAVDQAAQAVQAAGLIGLAEIDGAADGGVHGRAAQVLVADRPGRWPP